MARVAALLGGAMLLLGARQPATTARPATRPDVVVIVLDDMGFSDFGSFGSEIRTPHIDALAADGLRYTRFETRAICSPTRAALLTGRNSQTVGMSDLPASSLSPPGSGKDAGSLAINAQTLAQVLHTAGYSTLAIGKWHLAPETEDGTPGHDASWPRRRGFDYFYGFISGWTDQYRPDLVENERTLPKPTDPAYHFSADIVDRAIGQVGKAHDTRPDAPVFLYLAFGATHAPIQVPRRYIDRYAGVYDRGWDAIRAGRFARQKQLGIVPAGATLPPPNAGDRPWAALSPVEKKVYARFMAAYAGFLEHTDEQVGRLVASLKARGTYDNTIFVLLSDNGASAEHGQTGSIGRLYPPAHLDAAELATHLDDVGKAQIGMQRPWSMASNTPFHRYKAWPEAGGVRTPLIVAWHDRIHDRGVIRRQAIDAIDIAPTLADLTGAHFDTVVNGQRQIPVAGTTIRPTLFSAKAADPRDVQFFELRGNRAIRWGKWRAVSVHRMRTAFDADRWALFDTSTDFAEGQDVAGRYPRILARMKARWMVEARRYGALPLSEGPDYVRKLDRYRDAFMRD